MKIAFLGSSLVSAPEDGRANYCRGILRALHERGYDITFLEPDIHRRQIHRDMGEPDWAHVEIYSTESEQEVLQAVERARRADLVVKASGVGVFDELLEESVLELQTPNRIVAFWDVDPSTTLDRARRGGQDPFRDVIPSYDVVFTRGGGQAVIEAYEALGANACVPIYSALDSFTCSPVMKSRRLSSDLVFLGNRLSDREHRVEEFFFNVASQLPQRTFLLGGRGWENARRPANVRYLGYVPVRDYNWIYGASGAVLSMNDEATARYGFLPPSRLFEATGAGACLITDDWEGIDMFLEPDTEVLVARNGAEVAEHLTGLTPERAKQIGRAASQRVQEQHTYAQRAEKVERVLEGKSFVEASL